MPLTRYESNARSFASLASCSVMTFSTL
jgi:hypothetical protein